MHPVASTATTPARSLYLVMNWVDGQQLRDFVTLGGGSREATLQVLRHLEQVADVLDWLHSGAATPSGRPIVHGALSTANVMITPAGQAVLVDFGLARLVAHQTQQAAGTPGYAAPEVWLSGQYSPAGDRYGFGAIAYFALTGRDPSFDRAEIREGFRLNPLLVSATSQTLDQVMEIFADEPERRPAALQWVRLLRTTATTTSRAAPATFVPPAPPTVAYRRGRHLVTGGICAALLLGVIVGASMFGGQPEPSTASTGSDPSSAAIPPVADVTDSPAVRRESGNQPILLNCGYGVDLDSPEPDWGVRRLGTASDITHSGSELSFFYGTDLAPVDGDPNIETCQSATAYDDILRLDSVEAGDTFCVRTNGGRFAFVTITDTAEPLELDVVVWEAFS